MGPQRGGSGGGSLTKRTGNKLFRQSLYVKQKQDREKEKREARFRRKKEEDADPESRRARLEKNQPMTIDRKRVWDDVDDDGLGSAVNMEQLLKRRRMEQAEAEEKEAALAEQVEQGGDDEEADWKDDDSMLGSDDDDDSDNEAAAQARAKRAMRDDSMAPSTTSTNLDLTPESLVAKFPTLFSDDAPAEPKVLITTSLNSTLHDQAQLLCTLFPNSSYIPRSAHKYGHKYSVREIAKFAANRDYSAIMVLKEDQKRPIGLDVVHLPAGPTFHFSISNWVEGKKLPGHGNPTNHWPELLLNNFQTPLGVLTARLFHSLFPKSPEFQGRQVVTLHNQRDYIFVRRHRYVFREKRATEKSVVGSDGKELKGVESIRAGLQELGPRFTLKLRRLDKGIGRAGSEGDDAVQWEWKAKMEKSRTRFNL
ncbi:anticodon-binding protein [Pseudomassariella vexata]|uniref:Anticodon-binding protein n=1 Tax=Pseudomassariella vexata TaxID=1141098 RepID=A0A1Y2EFE3_9PEZI|nr:anticodon-binding protein [Pseudomassariella vexata]ORY69525.1 anticodon-binding protein [Pseudomassariella vexata]